MSSSERMPPAINASSRSMRSCAESEFASLVVPKTASPVMPCSSNQRQCLTKRSGSGTRSCLAQEVAQGKTQAVIDHGGGGFSFKVGSDIVVYVSVQTGVRVTIEHIIG